MFFLLLPVLARCRAWGPRSRKSQARGNMPQDTFDFIVAGAGLAGAAVAARISDQTVTPSCC